MLDPLSSSFSLNTGSSAANSARNSIFLSAVSLNENEVEKPDMKSNYQQKIFELTESVGFGVIIFVFIFINTIVISFEVSEESDRYYGYYLQSIDSICVGIFILELFLRIFAWRTKFFNSWWHTFDLFLVILSLTTIILPHISITFQSPNVLALIRMARSLRIIRTVRTLGKFQFVKSIKMIIDTLMHSVQAMSVILFVSVIVFYIYTVLGVLAFSKVDPYRFQSLSSSYVVFLQVLSLDLWSDTAIDNKQVAPGMLYMFYSFIIIQAFVLLNLLTAVIVDNLAALRKNIGHHMKKSKKWVR
ncbi:Ion transport protein-domain-containing protein [Globomyces pollinis-pini]|nr:Ion transport protein-domain-containing protein [Globomyces pollinis-pini]